LEALRIIKIINDDVLPELNRYKGKSVEIIILPQEEDTGKKMDSILSLRGALKTRLDGMEFQNRIRKEWYSRNYGNTLYNHTDKYQSGI